MKRLAEELANTAPPPPLRRRDYVFALALVAFHAEEVLSDHERWPAALLVAGTVAGVATLGRRIYPLVAVLAAFSIQAVIDFLGGTSEAQVVVTFAHFIALTMLVYSLARWAPLRHAALGLGWLAAVGLAGEILVSQGQTTTEFSTVLVWAFVGAVALAMRYRARLGGYQRAETRHEERERIARELHDVVAHHVSAIAIQAQAAQAVVHQNPTAANEALGSIHSSASTALTEMRHMVALLREPTQAAELVPNPGPDAIRALVDSAAGELAVDLDIDGDLDKLPATVTGAIYRITQEALTNVGRHARRATAVSVRIRRQGEAIELDVNDNGAPVAQSKGGFGIVGMSERARILGGDLNAGPSDSGGWSVHASIPVGSAART